MTTETTEIAPGVRPDVVTLLTETDLGSVLDSADRTTWKRADGTPLTEAEQEMVATANRQELMASREQADRIVQVLREEVEAMDRIMEVTREHFVAQGAVATFGDVWPLLTDAERAELTPLLAIVGG